MRKELLLGTFFSLCFILPGIDYSEVKSNTRISDNENGDVDAKYKILRMKLLSCNDEQIAQAREDIVADRTEKIKMLVDIINDKELQKKNNLAVFHAVLLLANLRAEEAIPHLLDILLFDVWGWYKDKSEGGIDLPAGRPLIVEALVIIGLPSLEPVTKRLLSIKENTSNPIKTASFCRWVIKDILGTRLAEQYFLFQSEQYPEDSKEHKCLKEAADIMHSMYETEKSLKEKNADTPASENGNIEENP